MPTVLIVDDHPDIARALAVLTQVMLGCKSLVVHDGERALEVVQEQTIDLVVLDYHMPGMSGLDVLRRLRDEVQFESPPVIMYSADDCARSEAAQLGAVAFVPKTAAATALLPVMREHINCGGG